MLMCCDGCVCALRFVRDRAHWADHYHALSSDTGELLATYAYRSRNRQYRQYTYQRITVCSALSRWQPHSHMRSELGAPRNVVRAAERAPGPGRKVRAWVHQTRSGGRRVRTASQQCKDAARQGLRVLAGFSAVRLAQVA